MSEAELLRRITFDSRIFGGKPLVRGRRLAVEHILGLLENGDTSESILVAYPWMEKEDIQACLAFARRRISGERIDLVPTASES